MSVRENIELYGQQNEEQFVEILVKEFGAAKHAGQADAYMLDRLPFCAPRLAGDYISILSFNNVPLPGPLVEILVDSRELFPNALLIRWTREQDFLA